MLLFEFSLLNWFTNTESATRALCTPDGYNLLYHPRSNRVGGGTGILFNENITVKKLAAGELRPFEYSEWSVVNRDLAAYI